MGSSSSKPIPKYKFINTGEGQLESKTDNLEYEKRWETFIQSLDVGPENVRQIDQLDPDQKEQLLLNFEAKNPRCSASHYVALIKALNSGKSVKKSFNRKSEDDPVHVLSAIEVSLRTNNVDWVYDFLNKDGLEVLLDYMSKALVIFLSYNFNRFPLTESAELQSDSGSRRSSFDRLKTKNARNQKSTSVKRKTSFLSRLNRTSDSINEFVKKSLHQGLKCMRAILNNQRGCEMALEHSRAIDVITLCLLHPSYQTKTLVLETLAAICLIVNGLQKVLSAFDYFKEITSENRRFETLITYFRDHETFKVDDYNIDFMVSCTQFINIVVHSGEDINLRVYLQQEFTLLGLDEFYKKLEERSGDRLKKQVEAYHGNRVDVALLLEDADAKETLLLEVEKLEQELYSTEENYQNRIVKLENELAELLQTNQTLKTEKEEQYNEYMTLKQTMSNSAPQTDREKDLQNQINTLERVLKEKNISYELPSNTTIIPPPPSAPSLPPPPPIAPPPPMAPPLIGAPPPPGQPPGAFKLGTGVTNTQTQSIRPPIQTKYKLPMFNWTVLKNQQLKGTCFVSMNDEVLYKNLDFETFEDIFKLNSVSETLQNGLDHNDFASEKGNKKKPEKKTLLDANKHRCLGVLLRFLDQEKLKTDALCKSINQLEVSVEVADRILYQLPTADDIKTYRKYEYSDKLPINDLTDEDRLLMTLCKMERLQQKLEVVIYIQNFPETYKSLAEKVTIITRASLSIRSSQKLKQILEIILAYGNLMNSSRRGIMYGFRLQSLDLLTETKSVDKTWTLLQFLVNTVESKFPSLTGFCDELKFLEQASKIPMEAITTDVTSLVSGMKQVRDEINSNTNQPPRLKRFIEENEKLTADLLVNAQNAKETFLQAAEWFGERQNNPTPDAFFGIFYRFTENFKKCLEECLKKRAQLMLSNKITADESPKHKPKDNVSMEELQKKIAQEARKKKRRMVNRTRQITGDNIMDEILAGLDKTPLQAEIHPRRTNNRFQEEVF